MPSFRATAVPSWGLVLMLALACDQAPASADAQSEVGAALELAAGGRTHEATVALRNLPDEIVIPEVVRRLREDPRFTTTSLKSFAYGTLGAHAGAKTEIGYAALTECLIDPELRGLCVSALGHAAEQYQDVLTDRFVLYLNDPTTSNAARKEILRALREFGPEGVRALPQLQQVFQQRDGDRDMRALAFLAMLRVGTVEGALDQVRDEDAAIVIPQLARFREFAPNTLNTDERHRGRIYELFGLGLRHSDAEMRGAVMESVKAIFGSNMFVIRSRDDFELHPQLRAAIEPIAAADPDPGLRADAGKILDRAVQQRYVDRILAKRERGDAGTEP